MLRVVMLFAVGLAAGAAKAEVARVSSGEHADFTRIVIEFPTAVDWKVGRTADGYALRLPEPGTTYDLSRVYDLIGKDRLAAIWADPDSGVLQFGIGCACFAMPFELRPGTVVVDVRNGLAPEGSSFEEPLDGGDVPEPDASAEMQSNNPAAADMPQLAYDWTKALTDGPPVQTALSDANPALVFDPTAAVKVDLEPLRQSLIEQLSRGASDGVVEMAPPKRAVETNHPDGNQSVDIRLGDAPNLLLRQKNVGEPSLSADGTACIPDEKLDVAAWVKETPFSEQIGPALSNLIGEFDRPDPDAIKRATRFYLGLGFGTEARSILRAFPTDQEDERIWKSMARILDDEPDTDPVFTGMAACDTAAALWAVLADPAVLSVGQVEKSAILHAFSALPIHLRQLLGRTLVDRFLAMEDFATATALRDSVLRGTTDPGPEIELMEAAIERAGGSRAASALRLEVLAAQPGPATAEALVALIIQRAEQGQDVSFDQVKAMEEYAKEREDSEDHARFHLALTLAYGASGDFDSAFEHVAETPDAAPVLWQILAFAGKDSAFLDHATLAKDQDPPPAATRSASLIAQRMVMLGLADQAANWLELAHDPPGLLVARIALGQGDPQKALTLLGEAETPTSDDLRIEAYSQLGDEKAIAALYAAREMPSEEWRAVSRMRDWQRLAVEGPEVWMAAAASLLGPQAAGPAMPSDEEPAMASAIGPLERDRMLVDQSVATRGAITALLDTIKSPEPLSW